MSSFRRPQCPYCGKKVDFITTWMLRRKGEYVCSRCRGISTIKLDMKAPYLAVAAVLTTLILFFLLYFLLRIRTLKSLLWILLPILLFYLASLFLVQLRKPVIKKIPKKKKSRPAAKKTQNTAASRNYQRVSDNWTGQEDTEHTKIL